MTHPRAAATSGHGRIPSRVHAGRMELLDIIVNTLVAPVHVMLLPMFVTTIVAVIRTAPIARLVDLSH